MGMSDSEEVPMTVLKRRRAVERWKATHRDYHLAQKRQLASRPEYLAHRRAVYAAQQAELREAGILPRRKGRPRLYEGADALERRKERARINSARYRAKFCSTDESLFSLVLKNDESIEATSEDGA
jgi:hypothetical protein